MPHKSNLSDLDIQDIQSTAHMAADSARKAILPYFRSMNLDVENKCNDDFDPVTIADRAGEKAMRQVLQARRPNDGILGEEFGEVHSDASLRWVLDPIDGTRGFISGTPTWGVLIALEECSNGPIFGIIDQPYIKERFCGGLGQAYVEGPSGRHNLQTSSIKQLSEATLMTTFPEVGTQSEKQGFDKVAQQVKLVRYGMDCYAYALLAAGQIDLVIEAGLNAYDIQAPIAVIEAAGGVVRNWQGGSASQGGRVVAAANIALLEQALIYLEKIPND